MTARLALSIALLALWPSRIATAADTVHTWTDSQGVVHFSDTPPPTESPQGPVLLDEDTPIPATLNELFDVTPAPAVSILDAQTGAEAAAGVGADSPEALAPEALDALDPIWFRDNPGDPDRTTYVDEYGPFTIGEPIEDTRIPPEVSCRAARRDLAVLQESWPVYRDQGGRLRYQWARDPYRGARRYLDDEARRSAIASARQTLERACTAPNDVESLAQARTQLLREALCEAERAELAALESLGGDSANQALIDKRELVAAVCREPTASATAADAAAPPESAEHGADVPGD